MSNLNSELQNVAPSFQFNSLFDNNLIAVALIDQSGHIHKMTSLFSNISNQNKYSTDQNIFDFTLFGHPTFINQFDKLKAGAINEFALNHSIEDDNEKKYVTIKAFTADKATDQEGVIIILEETNNQCSIEEIIQIIGNSLEKSKDKYFFDTMCLSLSESLGIGIIFIGEYIKEENSIRSISFWNQDKYIPEFSYPIEESPTEVVMNTNSIRVYQGDVQEQFPNDSSLKYWDINNYIGCPLLNSQGEFVGYIGIMDSQPIRNISIAKSVLHIYSHSLGRELERMTQKKKIFNSKIELRDNQKLMQSIIETAQDAVITFNHNDKVIEWNKQASIMFGYEKEFATKMNFSQFVVIKLGGNNKSLTLKELVKTYSGKVTIERMEVTAKNKDGKEFPAELSLSPIKVNDSYVYSAFIRDITTYKKYESILNLNLKELNAKNKELRKYIDSNLQLENFAHIASHDLKEPLRSIGNFSQLLNKRLENRLDDAEQEFFNFILTGVQNMNQLIEDLLMYSSVNSQKTPTKDLDLNDVLFVVSRNLDKTIQDNKAELIINKLPESFVSSDTKIKQLFQNLIANAIKFKKQDVTPKIEVSCADIGEYWQFKIEDNGIGIKEAFKDKIFMIFKKLHSKAEYQGTGIGLAVCKKIVDHHQGKIWVESEFGLGTSFYFTLRKEG